MTRLLLDTTFLIDAERTGTVVDAAIDAADDVAIAAITLAELRVGALLAHGRRQQSRTAFVDEITEAIPLLGYDAVVAEAHAGLLVEVRVQGRPRGAHDMIIAATAKVAERTVVTADARAFADLPGVEVRLHR